MFDINYANIRLTPSRIANAHIEHVGASSVVVGHLDIGEAFASSPASPRDSSSIA